MTLLSLTISLDECRSPGADSAESGSGGCAMRSLVLILCAFATGFPASADNTIRSGANAEPPATLLERALDLVVTGQESRPTGQCIFTCGDQMVTLRRCPDGDCPAYDCRTGVASCSSR